MGNMAMFSNMGGHRGPMGKASQNLLNKFNAIKAKKIDKKPEGLSGDFGNHNTKTFGYDVKKTLEDNIDETKSLEDSIDDVKPIPNKPFSKIEDIGDIDIDKEWEKHLEEEKEDKIKDLDNLDDGSVTGDVKTGD